MSRLRESPRSCPAAVECYSWERSVRRNSRSRKQPYAVRNTTSIIVGWAERLRTGKRCRIPSIASNPSKKSWIRGSRGLPKKNGWAWSVSALSCSHHSAAYGTWTVCPRFCLSSTSRRNHWRSLKRTSCQFRLLQSWTPIARPKALITSFPETMMPPGRWHYTVTWWRKLQSLALSSKWARSA